MIRSIKENLTSDKALFDKKLIESKRTSKKYKKEAEEVENKIEQIVETYINGNISDAKKEIGNNLKIFNQCIDYMEEIEMDKNEIKKFRQLMIESKQVTRKYRKESDEKSIELEDKINTLYRKYDLIKDFMGQNEDDEYMITLLDKIFTRIIDENQIVNKVYNLDGEESSSSESDTSESSGLELSSDTSESESSEVDNELNLDDEFDKEESEESGESDEELNLV